MRLARRTLIAALVLGVAALMAAAQANARANATGPSPAGTSGAARASGSASGQDKAFMTSNAQTNLAEISAAKLALAKAGQEWHDLASKILHDHQTAQKELHQAARSTGFTLPSRPNATQLAQAKRLQAMGSAGFVAAFLQAQANGHRLSIKNTQAEIRNGSDPAVVAYAKKYLPVAESHLAMVNQAIVGGHFAATPAAPPSPISGSPSAVVTTGPLAHNAKASASSDEGWLIGLAVLIVLVIGGLLLRLRRSARPNK
jgi:putative membrane protein